MRCSRCQFENIPGQDRCLRCGSILDARDAVVNIHPPRMAQWKRPVRTMARWFRHRSIFPESIARPKVPDFLKIMSGNAFLGIILSIIPGLAHLVSGRFREVCWWVPAWFVVLLIGMFFFGSSIGLLFLGFAVGLHSWIAFNHALAKEHTETQQNLTDFVMLLVLVGLMYFGVRVTMFRDFVFGLSNMTIPYQKVQQGDTLLGRHSGARANLLPRGSLVIARFPQIYNYKIAAKQGYDTTGQVIALPGEKVEIIEGRFVVDGKTLEGDKFPVPGWMSGARLSKVVPKNCYFLSTNYKIGGYGMNLTGDLIGDACTVEKGEIEALAVMRWFPPAGRGFLRTGQ